jgi:hypothetical protein
MKNLSIFWTSSFSSLQYVFRCLGLLSRKGRVRYLSILSFQVLIAILDLAGLAIMMQFIIVIQNPVPHQGRLPQQMPIFLGNHFPNKNLDLMLSLVLVIFILKGVLALTLHSLNMRIMASETINLVKQLSKVIFASRTTAYSKLSSQDITYTLFNSTEMVFRDTLVPVSVIVADSVLIFLVCINLMINSLILLTNCSFVSIN